MLEIRCPRRPTHPIDVVHVIGALRDERWLPGGSILGNLGLPKEGNQAVATAPGPAATETAVRSAGDLPIRPHVPPLCACQAIMWSILEGSDEPYGLSLGSEAPQRL